MKKLYLLYTIILLTITSCNYDSPRFRIGISQCSDDEWRHKMNSEILREAFMYEDIEVEILTARDDSKKQVEDIRYFIDKGVDIIVVAPNEGAAMTPIVEAAYDKGIPVVVVDRKILSKKYNAYIGADNYEMGKAVGNYIAAKLNGKGSVVEISGLSNSTPAMERHDGFMEAITDYPDISLLCCEDAGWLQNSAQLKMDSLLTVYSDIDVVFAQNDRMAAGAYTAANNRGRAKDIQFIGIDALPGEGYGVDMVQNGHLAATFIYPTGGDKVLQTVMDILEKKPYNRETILNTAVIDSLNARVMSLQTIQISELDRKVEMLHGKISNYLSRYSTQTVVLYGSFIILLLVAGLLLMSHKALSVKNKLNDKLSKQKGQLEDQYNQMVLLSRQLEEATQAKLVFFTNISHDFRTPLTLVADPVDQLLNDGNINDEQRKLLLLVKKNANILLRLVNQILDFRKYENGKMEYSPAPVNLLECIETWNESFMSVARKKHIHFSFIKDEKEEYNTMADVEKLERIYFNLLSNAFKFTPENGRVELVIGAVERDNRKFYRFSVSNTGSIIPAEHIRNIFNRFYKIDMHHSGSGIGLALVKAFVEMHEGTIDVCSSENDGTKFTVEIPEVECTGELSNNGITDNMSVQQLEFEADEDEIINDYDSSKPTILIIDDNPDIRTYIHGLLSRSYTVIEASNGSQGIKKAMKYVPDLIISDVMMPGIDGIECCRRLKGELQTCHIPVILLTACSLDEQKVKGYAGGADSYISKPFSSDLLITRIHNLIESRKKMKQLLGDNSILVKESICDLDKNFVEKFKNLIDTKMGDSGLNVEDLGKQMGLSRVQLYRKIKSLTNYAPNELLRIARLKKAASLLACSEMTVAEIAYVVGFTSPSYFTKCYKDEFGESPTDFLKRNEKK